MKLLKVLLVVIAVVCIGVAVSYPIRYKVELDSNNSELEDLSSMRRRVLEEQNIVPEDVGEGRPQPVAIEPEPEGAEVAPTESETPEVTQVPTDEAATQPPVDTEEPPSGEAELAAPAVEEQPTQVEAPPADEQPTQTEAPAADQQPAETETPTADQQPVQTEAPAADQQPAGTEAPPAYEQAEATTVPSSDEQVSTTEPPITGEQVPTTEPPAADEQVPTTEPPVADTQSASTEPPAEDAGVTPTDAPIDSGAKPMRDAVTSAPLTPTPGLKDLLLEDYGINTPTPRPTSTPSPSPSPTPSPTPDRGLRDDPDTFKDKVKVRLNVDDILPELRDIYELNHDLVGWLYIDDTNIDYPVVQTDDGKYYLTHDFYGKSNANGQIILEDKCDPYTPSYNLVISGHHMNSGAMFGRLGRYKDKAYWQDHKIVEFDTLMARKKYVIFGAFYSADYDEYEEGFRYSADIQYKLDADMWLEEIKKNQIYETGVQVAFGDEFITLTTCDHSKRYNGRFVVVARRIREGERIL